MLLMGVGIASVLALLFLAGDILTRTYLQQLVPEPLRRLEGWLSPQQGGIVGWDTAGTVLFFIAGSALAPVFEESFFRGYLFDVVRGRLGRAPSYIWTSLFFAFVHLSLINFLGIFVASLVLCWIYERYGLLPAVAAHGTYNGLTLILYVLWPSCTA